MTEATSDLIHASCVAIAGRAVLLGGRSGAGKSDLALRLIDRGAVLVADDYTQITRRDNGRLFATPPARIAGRLEIRGVGLVAMPHLSEAEIALYVDLEAQIDRMPEPRTRQFASIDVPVAGIQPFEASAPIKIEFLLKAIS